MSKRVHGAKLPLENRLKSFNEVNLGLDQGKAEKEASRCLNCKNPLCTQGCPVGIDIPRFISRIKARKYAEALSIIKERNSLPAICGRVCPQENQCEKCCVLARKGEPIAIGLLERYVADWSNLDGSEAQNKPRAVHRKSDVKVAVIGSGSAGLTAAAELSNMGYNITLFESLHACGGVLRYGIPEFRLSKAILDKEIEYIKSLGVTIETNVVVGQTLTLEELWLEGFKAVFIGTGAGLPFFSRHSR